MMSTSARWPTTPMSRRRNPHFFIGVDAGRGVAYAMLELRSNVWRCTWEQLDAGQADAVTDSTQRLVGELRVGQPCESTKRLGSSLLTRGGTSSTHPRGPTRLVYALLRGR